MSKRHCLSTKDSLHDRVFGCEDLSNRIQTYLYWSRCDRLGKKYEPCSQRLFRWTQNPSPEQSGYVCSRHMHWKQCDRLVNEDEPCSKLIYKYTETNFVCKNHDLYDHKCVIC